MPPNRRPGDGPVFIPAKYLPKPKPIRDGASSLIGTDPQGNTLIISHGGFTTWTPSGVNKVKVISVRVVYNTFSNLVTLSEGVRVVSVDYSGSFLEVYSPQRFSVFLVPVIVDKDNIGADAEQAIIAVADPKVYSISKHTNVLGFGKTIVRSSKCVGPSCWYMKLPVGGILNRLVKPFLAHQEFNYTGSTQEFPEGVLDIIFSVGLTNDVSFDLREIVKLTTAEATPNLVIS